MRKEGKSYQAIAQALGVSKSAVHKWGMTQHSRMELRAMCQLLIREMEHRARQYP